MYGSKVRLEKPHEAHSIDERNWARKRSIIAERSEPLTRRNASLAASCSSDLYISNCVVRCMSKNIQNFPVISIKF